MADHAGQQEQLFTGVNKVVRELYAGGSAEVDLWRSIALASAIGLILQTELELSGLAQTYERYYF